jgi:hypothetical protein
MRTAATLVGVWIIASTMGPTAGVAGPALNQFEVKDLEAEAGSLQFQSQNAMSFGHPTRKSLETSPRSFAYDDNTVIGERYALEMQMGLARWFRMRVGIEYEKERVNDPASPDRGNDFANLNLTGVALEGVLVVVPTPANGVGLGVLTEFDAPVGAGAKQFYFGPIVQARFGPWSALANVLFVKHLGAADRHDPDHKDEKLDFAYAAQFQYIVSPTWAVALEAYGTIDRLGSTGTRSEAAVLFGDHDLHRLGPIVYYTFRPEGGLLGVRPAKKGAIKTTAGDDDDDKPGSNGAKEKGADGQSISVGMGVLFGLNSNTPDQTLKLSVEVNF